MKHKIIICIASLAFTTNLFSQNTKPVAEPSIAKAVINTTTPLPAEAIAPANIPFVNPNIELQLKPTKLEPVAIQLDNTTLPTSTIDTKLDNSRYYKTDEKLKPLTIPNAAESIKPAALQPKPSAKAIEQNTP